MNLNDLKHYRIGDDGEPAECSMEEAFMTKAAGNFIIKQDHFEWGMVSTVLLPIDHSYGDGAPTYFETMIFNDGGPRHLDCYRCGGKRADALAQHERVLKLVSMFRNEKHLPSSSSDQVAEISPVGTKKRRSKKKT